MNLHCPAEQIFTAIQTGDNGLLDKLLLIVGSADGARNQMLQGFIELFGGLLVRLGGLGRIAEGDQMDRMPEERSPR